MENQLNSCMGVLLRADLTGHGHSTIGWIGNALIGQPTKGHLRTVWMLLHNQTNQTNCWKKWNFLGFLRKIQISIDDSLCLIIICSHFVSIKSRKIRVFSKFSKNPVILPYKYLYLILLITKKPGHI